jgi:hypothetical protein
MKSETWEVEPPTITMDGQTIKLRPFAPLAWKRIQKARELTDEYDDTALALGYVVTSSLSPMKAAEITGDDAIYKQALDAAALTINMRDLQAVAEYLTGVFKRAEDAAVTVPEKPAAE